MIIMTMTMNYSATLACGSSCRTKFCLHLGPSACLGGWGASRHPTGWEHGAAASAVLRSALLAARLHRTSTHS